MAGPERSVALVAVAVAPVSMGSVVHPDTNSPTTSSRAQTGAIDIADRVGAVT
ncbi:hypothetical protein [Gordonia sihwensis]|uniref:hypothetical protein n=1 Tax=Gordonia sihwensis TaxID=173559 RepID=UPI000B23B95E|nr:hypothetical protein [Gordonia sihwensis]